MPLIQFLSNVVENIIPNYYTKSYHESHSRSPYDTGHKWCGACEKFFKELGRKCPDCDRFLRYKPKGQAKTEYNKRHGVYDNAYRMTDEPILLQQI